MSSREAFGPNLRRRRIRSGLSLEELSLRTKVSVELWDGMEKNDFSRWPAGVVARAHIRAYAEAVGADPVATVDEFCRVVPQGDRRAERIVRGTAEFLGHQLNWSDDLPRTLTEGDRRAPAPRPAAGHGSWLIDAHPRALAVGVDVAAVIVCSGTMATAAGVDFWKTLAATALFYHGVSVVLLGCSPAVWAIDTYIDSHHPRRASDPVFTRLALIRNDDPAPDRDTAA